MPSPGTRLRHAPRARGSPRGVRRPARLRRTTARGGPAPAFRVEALPAHRMAGTARSPSSLPLVLAHGTRHGGRMSVWGALREFWDTQVELHERMALRDRPWEEEFLHWSGGRLHGWGRDAPAA